MQGRLAGLALLAAIAWAAPSFAQTAAVTTNSSAVIAAGNTFQTILAAVPALPVTRRSLTIQNNNTTTDNCWIFVGAGGASKGTSILLPPAWSYSRYFPYVPADAIQATCATTGNTIYVESQ
jgi:hypothetical protein